MRCKARRKKVRRVMTHTGKAGTGRDRKQEGKEA